MQIMHHKSMFNAVQIHIEVLSREDTLTTEEFTYLGSTVSHVGRAGSDI